MRSLLVSTVLVLLAACGTEGADGLSAERGPGAEGGSSPAADGGPPGADAQPAVPEHGLRSDWFDLFADKKATRFDVAAAVNHDEATGPAPGIRGILYSARFSGRLTVPVAGEVALIATNDDGLRLFLDDELVIDDWNGHPPKENVGKATVEAGEHDLRIEYFQGRGTASLSLEWQLPGAARSPIPVEAMKPLATPPLDDQGNPLGGPRPSFNNPVIPFDCPDPGIASAPGPDHPRWVLACTGGSIPVRVSDDLVTWSETGNHVIPGGKAPWSANGGRNWAPEIHKVGAGWVAYFTAADAQNRLAIGCSYASAAEGPYTDCGESMIEDAQGVIDPSFFEDTDGKRYIYFKLDGNAFGNATPIYVHELAADGRSVAPGSVPVALITNDQAWEGAIIEGPFVVKHDNFYYLFYSGNAYDSRYRTGVARATSPRGPFTKKGPPILGNNAFAVGNGHGSIFRAQGKDYYFHHGWPTYPNGAMDGSRGRIDFITPITWADGWPVLGDDGTVPSVVEWP